MNRPTGITILAILALLGGLVSLIGALTLLLGGALAAGTSGVVGVALGALAIFTGLTMLVSALLSLAFAYGAWNLKPWGWLLGVVTQGFSLFSSLLALINGSDFGSQLFGILVAGGILVYLFRPDIKAAFGRS